MWVGLGSGKVLWEWGGEENSWGWDAAQKKALHGHMDGWRVKRVPDAPLRPHRMSYRWDDDLDHAFDRATRPRKFSKPKEGMCLPATGESVAQEEPTLGRALTHLPDSPRAHLFRLCPLSMPLGPTCATPVEEHGDELTPLGEVDAADEEVASIISCTPSLVVEEASPCPCEYCEHHQTNGHSQMCHTCKELFKTGRLFQRARA